MVIRIQVLAVVAVLLVSVATAGAGVEFTPYGYIKLDASFDSALTNDGNYAYLVLPYAGGEEQSEFNMTAKQTRVGLKFEGGGSDDIDLSGVIEFDFYGGGAENKPNPMLRKAYMVWKTEHVDILAGQTSDVISPIVPTTLNYIVLWKSGDIGYRRPQIRLSKAAQVGGGSEIELQLAATRSMGVVLGGGEKIAAPALQGRFSFGTEIMGHPASVGVSGLMGREEITYVDSLANMTVYELDQSVVAVDVTLPLGDMVALKGQYFTGKNLAQYLGGVGQSFADVPVEDARSSELEEIEASGWWAQLTLKPNKMWQVNVGAGTDDPEIPDGDMAGNMYEKNTTYYGNILWNVAKAATIGAEYAMFETEYVGGEKYEDSRVQMSFMYKF
jgi:hypothetical protein